MTYANAVEGPKMHGVRLQQIGNGEVSEPSDRGPTSVPSRAEKDECGDALNTAELQELVSRIAQRDAPRTEAMVQADIRQLLLGAELGLAGDQVVQLESPVAGRRRIDVEVGLTIIEVKKDLRKQQALLDAEDQLSDYVADRTASLGLPYVGIVTDGCDWRAYRLQAGQLEEVTRHEVAGTAPVVDELLVWLEGVMATSRGVPATPREVRRRLGPGSSGYTMDLSTLRALYEEHRTNQSVQLKRELWAKMLRTALGTQFEDTDQLFLEHTLLVNTAEIIAHAVLDYDPTSLAPATLLGGQLFEQAAVHGVVEEDFFDWVIEVPGGTDYVHGLARRLARFEWGSVEHDVLKVLYETVIGAETRRRLGEYYTPDWLAEEVVYETVADPLNERVLDPACGSGTFLFHAVARYLKAAEAGGVPVADALRGVSSHVVGLDLHPVAVALARVTYLLAIGQERLLDRARGAVHVSVYLGDSVQWHQRTDLFSAENLVIRAGDDMELIASELRFPESLLADAGRFDRLVKDMAELATSDRPTGSVPSLAAVFRRLAIGPEYQDTVSDTFSTLCRLHDEGRDHIWSYYIRNLSRPVWLAREGNRVDVLVGNPPWLSYRHMPNDMQAEFRRMSESRGMWHGAAVATHQDLAGLFVVRAAQHYLKIGGRLGFVLPNAALDRGYYEGFRSGSYQSPSGATAIRFTASWDLRRLRPHFFPRASCVVFGERSETDQAAPLPATTESWSGRLPAGAASWSDVKSAVTREPADLRVQHATGDPTSPYREWFSQGATFVPRVLFTVERRASGPLGGMAGQTEVVSARSAYEKEPWKSLPPLEGVVEDQFIRDTFMGECILPFRALSPRPSVVPVDGKSLMSGSDSRIDLYPGLAKWWRSAEAAWNKHGRGAMTLVEQLDYRSKLSNQLPPPPEMIVYAASGMHVVAARIAHAGALIDKSLYWASVESANEARYLCAILNSPSLTERVRPLMSYGKDERHVDKFVWQLPIPKYDVGHEVHRRLAELAGIVEREHAAIPVDESASFISLRRTLRERLAASAAGKEMDELVVELVS